MPFAPAEPPSPNEQPSLDLLLAGLLAVIALTGCVAFGVAEWDHLGRNSLHDLFTRGGPVGLVVIIPAVLMVVLVGTAGIRLTRDGATANPLSVRLLLPACCLCLLAGLVLAGYGLQEISSPNGRYYYFENLAREAHVRLHLGAPDPEYALSYWERVEEVSPAARTSLAVAARVLQIGVLGALAYAVSSVRVPWRGRAGSREDLRHLRLPTSVKLRLDLLLIAVVVVSIVWLPRTEVRMPEPKPLERKVAAFLPKTVDPSRIGLVIEVGPLHFTDPRYSALLRRIGELAEKERPRSLAAVVDASPELAWGELIAVVDTLMCNEVYEVYYARSSDEPYRDRIYVNGVELGAEDAGSRFDPTAHPAIARIIGGPWPTDSEPR